MTIRTSTYNFSIMPMKENDIFEKCTSLQPISRLLALIQLFHEPTSTGFCLVFVIACGLYN